MKLMVIDVDGTLHGPNGVAPRVWPALLRGRQAGLRYAIATGRPGRGVALGYAQRLEPDGLHVFEAGGAVVHGSGRVAQAKVLGEPAVVAAISLAERLGIPLELYTAEGGYFVAARDDRGDVARHESLLGIDAEVAVLRSVARCEPVVRAQWLADRATIADLERRALAIASTVFQKGVSPEMPWVVFAAVTAEGVSKRSGVAFVAESYGFQMSEVAVVGDASNDVPAMLASGLAIAMQNAAPEVKGAAHHVVGTCAEGGVADAVDIVLSAMRS